MCGIAAVIGKQSNKQAVLAKMLGSIAHRGDAEFQQESSHFPDCSIGVNRLAIVDRKNADQSRFEGNGCLSIAFNGEIYNYIELQKSLQNKGVRSRPTRILK